jgi:hypothetical protein
MTSRKMSRRRALQIMAGSLVGIVAQRALPSYGAESTAKLGQISPEKIANYIIPYSPHGTVPAGLEGRAGMLQMPSLRTPPPPQPPQRPPKRPPQRRGPAGGNGTGNTSGVQVSELSAPSSAAAAIVATNSDRFMRMFSDLPAFAPSEGDLQRLAETMIEGMKPDGSGPVEVDEKDAPSNNPDVPAGYTYLGQFIDHDLTFNPMPIDQSQQNANSVLNFRTPRFDLENVYANGPADNPFLYQSDGIRFLIGKNKTGEDDLPRNSDADDARALIGDPRNDENLIVSQLHLAFLKYHNRVVDELGNIPDPFNTARLIVRRHYHWLILKEILPRFVGQAMVDTVLSSKPLYVKFSIGQPSIPVEFAGATYRFGHSMVRSTYSLNAQTFGDETDGVSPELVIFNVDDPNNVNANDLRGFRRRPADRLIDWSHFFEFSGRADVMQNARAFDTQIANGLGRLPTSIASDMPSSLAMRNLLRGVMLGLPSGQALAHAMNIPAELIISLDNPKFRFTVGTGYMMDGEPEETVPALDDAEKAYLENVFGHQTPLWYYILKEAELINKGRKLGPLGGRIVAEVFIALLLADPNSILTADVNWQPTAGKFGAGTDGQFTVRHFLTHST